MSNYDSQILIQSVYPYEIPKEPSDEKLIINHDIKNKSDQFWRTPTLPDFKRMSAYEQDKFIYQEWERIENGIHFLNNGEVVYVNGAHYEYLMYWKLHFEIGFRHVDRLYFYFDEFIKHYISTFGKVVFKPRVGGFTEKENFLSYRESKAGFGHKVALINTTIKNAQIINYHKVREAFKKYPIWLKPNINTLSINDGFDYISSSDNLNDGEIYLGGYCKPFAPKANSLDGQRMKRILFDECFKLESLNPEDVIDPYFKTMRNPGTGTIDGRMTFVSTLGTDDKLMRQAIDFGLKMWRDSNIEEIDDEGFTRSKLLRYFINCYEVMFIDQYGVSDEGRAMEHQENELRKIIEMDGEFSVKHIKELRENPRTIDDILNSPKTGATFNVKSRVTKRKEALLITPVEARGYVTGKFIMTDNGVVEFDTNPIYAKYGWKMRGTIIANRRLCKKIGGEWKLPQKPEGVVGYDGVLHNKPTSNHFSQPAIKIFKKLDHHAKNGIKRQMIGQYYGRQEDNDDVSEQAALAAIYFGFYLAPERNTGIKYFEQNGYDKLIPLSWYDNGRGLMMTTGKGKKNIFEHAIQAYYKWIIGKQIDPKTKKEIYNVDTTVFEETLDQQETFVPERLSEHDIIAADFQCFLVAEKLIPDEGNKIRTASTLNAMYQSFS
jgi:hypothetical protein